MKKPSPAVAAERLRAIAKIEGWLDQILVHANPTLLPQVRKKFQSARKSLDGAKRHAQRFEETV